MHHCDLSQTLSYKINALIQDYGWIEVLERLANLAEKENDLELATKIDFCIDEISKNND